MREENNISTKIEGVLEAVDEATRLKAKQVREIPYLP
jgi:hypothetical protein